MKQDSFIKDIEEIKRLITLLSSEGVILFSASCSERFIGLYNEFSELEGWGDFPKIRNSLDLVWTFLAEDRVTKEDFELSKETVLQLAPPSDSFRSPETIPAQLACGCLYTTIQLCLGEIQNEYKPGIILNFIFDNLKATICFAKTGAWSLGSSPEEKQFEETLLDDPIISKELELQKNALNSLISKVNFDAHFINRFRREAELNQWTAKDLLGSS